MLSYSSYEVLKCINRKVVEATRLAKKAPEEMLDGELQVDAAIVPLVAKSKAQKALLKVKQTH